MSLEIHRPRNVTLRQLFNLCLMAAFSAYFLYAYQTSGWTYDIVCGTLFAVWSLIILWHILTKRVRFKETPDGFESIRVFRNVKLRWDQLVAQADPAVESRIIFLVYRDTPDGKDRYLGISKKVLGEDQIAAVIRLIHAKRPDLAVFADGKVQP